MIDSLARIGVIILLFEVGLESTVQGMMKVGASSLLVAMLGIIASFILGLGVSWLFIKELPAELAAVVPAGFSVLEKGLNQITVGVGMIPRGEVGLIFASIGKSLKVIDDATFSAVVIMVIVTTLITPPVLKITLARRQRTKRD